MIEEESCQVRESIGETKKRVEGEEATLLTALAKTTLTAKGNGKDDKIAWTYLCLRNL